MANEEQAALWNEGVGGAWVEHASDFDRTIEPFGAVVIDRLDVRAGERVVDVGCGTGSTTLTLARRAAPAEVVGLDLSATMTTAARARAESAGVSNVRFVEADVQADDIGTSVFDVAFSRFGVMFFSDPKEAFTNIRGALVDGGRLGFVCFQAPPDNPFIVLPILAAAEHLPMGPLPGPGEPSPFSLADPDHIRSLLTAAGFTDIEITSGPTEVFLGTDENLATTATQLLEMNPGAGPALAEAAPDVRAATIGAASGVLEGFRRSGEVRMPAATWIVLARA